MRKIERSARTEQCTTRVVSAVSGLGVGHRIDHPSMLRSTLRVNGQTHVVHAEPNATLLDVLRHDLHFTGAKLVCGRGECGACTVLLDGRLAYACLTLTHACDSATVTSIEGVGTLDGLHRVQQAFLAHDAAQCGFCTAGQVLAGVALLEQNPHPSDDDITRA